VLFLGDESGQARIVDAPNDVELVDYSTLLAEWDNLAVIICDNSSYMPWGMVGLVRQAVILCVCTCLVIMLNKIPAEKIRKNIWNRIKNSVVKFAIWFGAIMTVALSVQAISGFGIIGNPEASGLVYARFNQSNIPSIDKDKFFELLKDQEESPNERLQLVDARMASAFNAGTIPGSVNVPINSTNQQLLDLTRELVPSRKTVVFCQNSECPWAEVVAHNLMSIGFNDVSVYVAGYSGYCSAVDEANQ
jgi:rhodanese-related sulfurtransferase